MKKIAIVYTPLDSLSRAKTLATRAVQEKVAVCVNIIPAIVSIYEWEGKIENSQECIVIFKTSTGKTADLIKWIQLHHPYAVPAVLSGEVDALESFYNFVQSAVLPVNDRKDD
jgi:periplasmic divalent cation tolerance protein